MHKVVDVIYLPRTPQSPDPRQPGVSAALLASASVLCICNTRLRACKMRVFYFAFGFWIPAHGLWVFVPMVSVPG